ncbi:hypothetical protein [Microbacterium sp. S1037]|uniref:hypothetical protein n=1 Tax=Microbacterium sp. S1037 TaxID=3398227 RepID=UPI003AB03399
MARILLAPAAGLPVTWLAVIVLTAAACGPRAAGILTMGSLSLMLLLMLALAAYMPPSKPFRETSELAARVTDLVKVSAGAALFGAAAAYGGVVGAVMDTIPLNDAASPATAWSATWPIVAGATLIGSSVVGVRLGWDFRRSGHRSRLLALGKLRALLPHPAARRHPAVRWLADVVITASRSGTFVLVGYLSPVIILGDITLSIGYLELNT